ncbi:MAG: hypothetical protein P4L77_12025 [Sulfuriferula sp.]|nr:hypothetical protein [Sulfuriferula sp.]
MSAALTGLGELAERGAQKLTETMENSKVGRGVLNMTGNQEWELDLTPGGRAVKAMQSEYIRLHDKALGEETAKLAKLREWHQNDDVARNTLPIKTTTMAGYHAHATATGHPIQAITQPLASDPETMHMTQQKFMVHSQQRARLAALTGSFGDHFQNAAPIIAQMRLSKDPRIVDHAQRVADIISNQTRDTFEIADYTGTRELSSLGKKSINKAFITANKTRDLAEEPQIPLLKTDKTYVKQEEPERTAHRVVDTMMLPLLAIKHIGQFFNPVASSPLPAIGAQLLRMDHAHMEQTVEAAHILASTVWREMYNDILGETGKVSQYTNSPTLGKILSRTIHQPGFTWMRKQQLNWAGAVGFHSAIHWASEFATQGSKIAEARLREMEINPSDVLKQGGKLSEEQLSKAVYHYTNNRMFFNKSIDNALWQNRNVFTRSMFMYHSFVNSQASFMKRELLLAAKAGDYKSLAQFAGTTAILFPSIAPLIGGAEKMLQTGSMKQGADEVKQRYGRLLHPKSVPDWIENYLALMSHLGAAGVYFNYINAIKGHRLASAMAGPIPGMLYTDAEDIYGAATGHSAKPLERDILRQTVPLIGGPLAHHLAPTVAEDGSTGRRSGGKFRLRSRGLRRR